MITVNKKVKKAVVAVLSLILLGGAIAGIATAKSHAAGEKSQRKQVLQAVPAAGTYAKAPKIEDVEYDDAILFCQITQWYSAGKEIRGL